MSIIKYVLRRSLYLIPVFFGITLLVFTIERLAGDPVQLYTALNPHITEQQRELLRRSLHLDQPIQVQYLSWLSDLFSLNLGFSFKGGSVATLIAQKIWATLELQLLGLTLSLIIAIPIGVLSARRRYSALDVTITSTSLIGTSIPIFFLGVAAILIFGYDLHWFPSGGYDSILSSQYPFGNLVLDHLWHLVLPTTVYTFAILAPVVLLVRSSMLEVLRQDYILAARASGLRDRTVIYRHGLRNALIPIVTYVGLYFGGLLAGAPVTETVFNWPGVGRQFVESTTQLDFPVIQAIVVIITLMTLVANLITDVTYAYIDPRIRLE
ncbi:ABC transporter permease [Candidatus Bathyarchaeota archaeon]|nr:MAG: ABC transporter permease [Candidatus Bathyarchaeota archaeon]